MHQYATYIAVHRTLRGFKPKVRISFDKAGYTVKTVENWSELEEVLKLRHEVFHREFMGKKLPLGIDMDRYDPTGDHLVIIDKDTGRIVGTYRLICSTYAKNFYSASEFDLDTFLKLPGTKLELSRACIHRDYRDGMVIALLWRGLTQYIQQTQAAFLFGCASIRSMDRGEVASIYRYLEGKGFLTQEYQAGPVPAYRMSGLPEAVAQHTQGEENEGSRAMIPPLLNSYLRAGAKVCGLPALDESFQCVDFLTVLKMSDLSALFERKYNPT